MTLTIAGLEQYATLPFPTDYPPGVRDFFAPVDNVHGALAAVVASAQQSLAIAMFGFDDQALADAVKAACANPAISVQITLDTSQAAGAHEKEILAAEGYPATVLAVGNSEKGAIMHLKMVVVDGLWTVTGSTNWSGSAQVDQDNQLVVVCDRAFAARARARIDAVHAWMVAHPVHPPAL